MTPLHLAITVGSPIATRILLENATSSIIDCKYCGSNALHLAAKLNKTECIRAMSQFLMEGINGEEKWKYLIQLKNDENMLPVMLSDECECIKVIFLLLCLLLLEYDILLVVSKLCILYFYPNYI